MGIAKEVFVGNLPYATKPYMDEQVAKFCSDFGLNSESDFDDVDCGRPFGDGDEILYWSRIEGFQQFFLKLGDNVIPFCECGEKQGGFRFCKHIAKSYTVQLLGDVPKVSSTL